MLSRKDKETIRSIFREELTRAFQRDMLMEISPRKPGDPPKHEKEMRVNVLDELVKYFPYIEGAIRGCQTDSASARNRAEEVKNGFVKLIEHLDSQKDVILLEDKED